jgi:ABC-type transport system involved in multi-copper enzyme maturation permease subunit
MQPTLGLIYLTFRELWAKKVVLGLFLISSLLLVMVAFALNLDVVDGSLAGLRLFGQSPGTMEGLSLERLVFGVEAAVAGAAYWLGILLALFATAPLMVSMLERGHIDLLLSKPMSRSTLFLSHVTGVWAAVAVLTIYLLGGVWMIMSLKTGVWNASFLISIVLVVVMFGVMYGTVALMGVWTESTALALIVSYGLIFASLVLAAHEAIVEELGLVGSAAFSALYHVLPNFAEVTTMVANLSRAEPVTSWYPLTSSLLFGLVVYALATWQFTRRDF